MLTVVADGAASEQDTDGTAGGVSTSLIDEIVRDGARAMLAQAVHPLGVVVNRPSVWPDR